MSTRELHIVILGEIAEIDEIFESPDFIPRLATELKFVSDPEEFDKALGADEIFDLVIAEFDPHGIQILDLLNDRRPACPVIMVAEPDKGAELLKAKRRGLDRYLLRIPMHRELCRDLLAEMILSTLIQFIEPPSMRRPTADQLYRYAQYYNILEPFYVLTQDRRLLYFNDAATRFLSRIHGEAAVIGAPVEEWVLEESLRRFREHIDRAFTGHPLVSTRRLPALADEVSAAGGDEATSDEYELHYKPVADPSGRVIAVSIAVEPAARPELLHARMTQAINDFAAGVAHHNNNLLSIILSNVELLGDRLTAKNDLESQARLAPIRRAVARASNFTHKMQALSRTSVRQPETIYLNEFLRDMEPRIRRILTPPDSVELEFDLEPNQALGPISIDPAHLNQVLTELVRNAVDAMPEGGLLRIRTYHLAAGTRPPDLPAVDADRVVLQVCDSGMGIAPEDITRIFEPFYTTHPGDAHIGLGLPTSRNIVEYNGGHITVHSSPGRGSTLRVYLPINDAATTSETRDH